MEGGVGEEGGEVGGETFGFVCFDGGVEEGGFAAAYFADVGVVVVGKGHGWCDD